MAVEGPTQPATDVPKGHVASIITHLEMREKPELSPSPSRLSLARCNDPPLTDYLDLFRRVGEPWLWTSRLLMPPDQVETLIHDPDTAIYIVREGTAPVGFAELDFRRETECEISFFGLLAGLNGKGHGRWLMEQTLDKAWRTGIERVWLHTCTHDSPRALPFYQRCGFRIVRQQLEVAADPRLSGHLPLSAAPHVPIFR